MHQFGPASLEPTPVPHPRQRVQLCACSRAHSTLTPEPSAPLQPPSPPGVPQSRSGESDKPPPWLPCKLAVRKLATALNPLEPLNAAVRIQQLVKQPSQAQAIAPTLLAHPDQPPLAVEHHQPPRPVLQQPLISRPLDLAHSRNHISRSAVCSVLSKPPRPHSLHLAAASCRALHSQMRRGNRRRDRLQPFRQQERCGPAMHLLLGRAEASRLEQALHPLPRSVMHLALDTRHAHVINQPAPGCVAIPVDQQQPPPGRSTLCISRTARS